MRPRAAAAGRSFAGRLVVLASLLAPPAIAGVAPPPLRDYDLRPGDHLVYREWLERRVEGSRIESLSEAEWQSHVLVVSAGDGFVRTGFQRNRTRAELVRYRERGSDRLETGRRDLAEALAKRGVSFAEANWLTAAGLPLLPWSAVREAASERLPLVHEVEPLPVPAAAPGAAFTSRGPLALPLRFTGVETVGGEQCLRFEGEGAGGAIKLRQWHCDGTRTLGRLEYEARYDAPGGAVVSERFRLERVSQSRQQTLAAWLQDPATAQGALTALVSSDRLAASPAVLDAALAAGDPATQRLALAAAWRHRLAPPSLERLRVLLASRSARVRTLAVRLLALRPEAEARALRAAAASDGDPFVRAAATADASAPDGELLRLALAVRGTQPLPPWGGPLEAGIGRRLLEAQRAAGQAAGTTLRFMRDERYRGRPYVLHVPDDYRGDEPFPLLIVLGGGAGRALAAAQVTSGELRERGELVAFPQANGMWWEKEPAAAFAALLRELLGELNVDTDRVTITGYSNGGTGTLLFASRMPDRFAAFASLEGGGLPFFRDTAPVDAVAVAHLPALFVHGSRDEIIPSFASEETAAALRKANPAGVAELHLLPQRGHDVVYGRDEGLTLPFLARFTREAFPRRVALRASSLEAGRAFWLELVEKGGAVAQVDGTIDGQAITLKVRGARRVRLRLRRELVDLSAPLRVSVNGREAFAGTLREDPALFLRSWRETGDPQLAYGAELVLDVK